MILSQKPTNADFLGVTTTRTVSGVGIGSPVSSFVSSCFSEEEVTFFEYLQKI
ncbi:hypothetical protein [Thermoflexibacter ruber]|uniref:hypothetical protein n=1 Tax=Thermoflexibacter ruber TaxID=1003 RepID=UPI0015A72993|nr:hypothetical protein [Thermoflexibacter ruber]